MWQRYMFVNLFSSLYLQGATNNMKQYEVLKKFDTLIIIISTHFIHYNVTQNTTIVNKYISKIRFYKIIHL